jgi:proteic killer suppression protein
MITTVVLSTHAVKQLKKLPKPIVDKLKAWISDIEVNSLEVVKLKLGYHDEGLIGKRQGQRSVRLNRSYRVIYSIANEYIVEVVLVEEVTKHVY